MEQLWEKIRENLDWFANVKLPDEVWEQIKEDTTKEIFKHDIIRNNKRSR